MTGRCTCRRAASGAETHWPARCKMAGFWEQGALQILRCSHPLIVCSGCKVVVGESTPWLLQSTGSVAESPAGYAACFLTPHAVSHGRRQGQGSSQTPCRPRSTRSA